MTAYLRHPDIADVLHDGERGLVLLTDQLLSVSVLTIAVLEYCTPRPRTGDEVADHCVGLFGAPPDADARALIGGMIAEMVDASLLQEVS